MSTVAPARGRRPSRETVRAALLDAAARTFARKGIDGSSVDDVAHEAGFTKGAVYSNFGSKDDLVRALVEERTSSYLALGLEAVSDPTATLEEKAQALGDRLTEADAEQRDWHLLLVELGHRVARTGQDQGSFIAQRQELHDSVRDAVGDQLQASGARSSLSPEELSVLLIALANGLAFERLLAPDDVPADLMGRALRLLVG